MEIKKQKYDCQNMRKMILYFPDQFRAGLNASKNTFLKSWQNKKQLKNIVICGMGGSALPSELLCGLSPLSVTIHKSYGLPLQAEPKSLIICASYSGNTEETISAFKEAIKRNFPVIAITTGGELAKLAKENKIPTAILPAPYTPPRLALGVQFAALLQILINHGILNNSFKKQTENLSKIKSKTLEKESKILAKKIGQKIPLIYASEKQKGLGLFWKNNFNENAKAPAFENFLPEMNHNEIIGFWKIKNKKIKDIFIVLILKDPNSHPRILKRIKIVQDILRKEKVKTETINLNGKNELEKIFNNALFGLWTSYWLALQYKVDPTLIEIIDEIKSKLKK